MTPLHHCSPRFELVFFASRFALRCSTRRVTPLFSWSWLKYHYSYLYDVSECLLLPIYWAAAAWFGGVVLVPTYQCHPMCSSVHVSYLYHKWYPHLTGLAQFDRLVDATNILTHVPIGDNDAREGLCLGHVFVLWSRLSSIKPQTQHTPPTLLHFRLTLR